jgi:AcrR family transcriptional regulator
MATLRDRQKQLTRDTLLRTALELFGDNRYSSTTVDEIATAAGTTRATFYLHFSSKGELARALIDDADRILVEIDKPPLREVVASGDPALIREYIGHKFDQWDTIKPYLLVAHQAAPGDPEVIDLMESWFEGVAQNIKGGLDDADRFLPETRRIRGVLAFGQLEYLSMRWFRFGWLQPREVCLDVMVDSWCHLLIDEGAAGDAGTGPAA